MRPSPKWILAISVYRKGDWNFQLPGRLYAEAGLWRAWAVWWETIMPGS